MNIREIIDAERIDLAMQLDMLSETELNIIDFALERIEDAVMKRIAELELRLGCCRDASTGKDLLIAELEKESETLKQSCDFWQGLAKSLGGEA